MMLVFGEELVERELGNGKQINNFQNAERVNEKHDNKHQASPRRPACQRANPFQKIVQIAAKTIRLNKGPDQKGILINHPCSPH